MQPLLLYSGGCRVCRWAALQLSRVDSTIGLLPFRDPLAHQLLWNHLDEEKLYQRWWFRDTEGLWWEGNRGGLAVLLRYLLGFARPTLSEQQWSRFSTRHRVWWVRGLNRVDDWVCRMRPKLAPWVPDVPEVRR